MLRKHKKKAVENSTAFAFIINLKFIVCKH